MALPLQCNARTTLALGYQLIPQFSNYVDETDNLQRLLLLLGCQPTNLVTLSTQPLYFLRAPLALGGDAVLEPSAIVLVAVALQLNDGVFHHSPFHCSKPTVSQPSELIETIR